MKKTFAAVLFIILCGHALFAQSVEYDMANITNDSLGRAIDFDINISSTSDHPYYLQTSNVYLNVTNSPAMTVTGPSYSLLYNYANYIESTSGYQITIQNLDFASMFKITSAQAPLYHVHLSYSDCGITPDISFDKGSMDTYTQCDSIETTVIHTTKDSFYMSSDGTYDSLVLVPVTYTIIDTVTVSPTLDTSGYYNGRITCHPVITTFTHSVPAGVNDTMIIYGYNFGNRVIGDTNSTVKFVNADDPDGDYIRLDTGTVDIKFWDDSEIDLVLPTCFVNSAITGTPGSGPFKVINNVPDSTISTGSLEVPYAVANTVFGTATKVHIDLVNTNGIGGYTVYVNPKLAAQDTNVIPCIKTALLIWACATHVNWYLVKDSPISNYDDSTERVCYITRGKNDTDNIAETGQHVLECNSSNAKSIGFDMTFDSNYTWFYDATGNKNVRPSSDEDFFSAMIHELGHALSLDHINEEASVMYYSALPGDSLADNRMLKLNDTLEVLGGGYVVNHSEHDNMTGCDSNMQGLTVVYCNFIPTKLHVTGVAPSCTCNKSHTIKLLPTVVGGFRNYTYVWDTIPGKGHINTAVLSNPTDSNPTVKWFTGTPHIIAMQVKVLDNSMQQETAYGSIYDTITGDSTASAAYAMHDGPLDVFDEPDVQQTQWPWTGIDPEHSQDIWNRYKEDGITVYEEPGNYYNDSGRQIANYAYIRIYNIGCERADTSGANAAYLHVYWTIASLSERWRCDWFGQEHIWTTDSLFSNGMEITPHRGLKLGGLAPGKDTLIAIPWFPPNPAEIPRMEYTQLCMLARIIKPGLADSGLNPKYKEEYERPLAPDSGFDSIVLTGSIYDNVKNHYNIATHNMHVFHLSDSVVLEARPIGTGYGGINGYVNWQFNIEPGTSDGLFDTIGVIKIKVGPVLYNRWMETGGTYAPWITLLPDEYAFQITGANAWINGIPLTYLDTAIIYVQFNLTDTTGSLRPAHFLYNLTQYLQINPDSATPTGSFDYEADVNTTSQADTVFPNDTVTTPGYYGYAIGLTNPLIVTPDTTLGPVTVSNMLNFNTNITFNIMNAGSAIVASYSASNVSGPVSNNFDITSLPDGFYTAQALEYADVVLTESFLKITPNPVLVYPNPTTGVFSVSTSFTYPTHVFISVYDMAGDLLQQSSPVYIGGLYTYTFDISSYPDGNYIVSTTEDGTIFNSTVEMKISDGGGGGEY